MQLSEYYNATGSNLSYEAEGEYTKKEMIDAIKLDQPVTTKKLICDEPKYIYRKWQRVKEKNDEFRNGFLRCNQDDKGAKLITSVSVIQEGHF